jgi:ABC-type antimicrobial peptide transport system permease subunit
MTSYRILTILSINFKLCLLEIFTNKTRSFISSLGIFLGTASLLVNMTFLRGMQSDITNTMERAGGLSVVTLKNADPQTDEERRVFGRTGGLKLSEIYTLKERIPEITAVLVQQDLHWFHMTANGKNTGGRVNAVSLEHCQTYNYELAAGQYFSQEQFDRREKVCIIGSVIATELFDDPEEAVGKTITFNGKQFTVIGLIYTKDKFDRRSREFLIPFTVYQSNFSGNFGHLENIAVRIGRVEDIPKAKAAIEAQIRALHRGIPDTQVETNQDKIKEMETASLGMRILLSAIAFISLSVGSISIMNIMFGTIGDRIREIGVRKAIGAQRIDLFTQFLIEAVLISFVGGLPGILVGASITFLPEGTFPFTPHLSAIDFAIAITFIAVSGVASGVFPALKASNMEPIEALRY